MTAPKQPGSVLKDLFPLLWADPDTPPEVRSDLRLTELQLGRQYRRGKATRLALYQRMEDDRALTEARRELADARPVLDVLSRTIRQGSLLDAVSGAGPTLGGSTTWYHLSTIVSGPHPEVAPHRLDDVLAAFVNLKFDSVDVDLVREVVCTLEPDPPSVASIAQRHGISRQAASVRRGRLEDRLATSSDEPAIASLLGVVTARLRLGKPDVLDDPLLGIARVDPGRRFPSVVDAVRIALWLASPNGGDRPGGLVAHRDGSLLAR